MKRELKKEELSKLYRQFSRQKYNKYKHQFPRMRESELVSKIIKEWEAMDGQEKLNLFSSYSSQKHISDDKSESSQKKESPGSSKEKKKKSQSKSVSKGVRPVVQSSSTPSKKSGVRVFVKSSSSKKNKQQSQSSDFARDGVKKDFQISESDSKELGKRPGGKKKKITKQDTRQPKTEYLKFFKFYYEKLTKQHPRWSASQISTIIKLLWKKKLSQDKTASKTGLREPRARKSVSGRMAFRRAYNYTGIEGAERWKQLPGESKKYWRSKGFGAKSGERKILPPNVKFPKNTRKNSQSNLSNASGSKTFSYLKKTIS